MRTKIASLTLMGLVLCMAISANSGSWNAHRLDGRTIEYPYLDSVVTVWFTEDVSAETARNLALAQDDLRDDYMPWMLADRLFVFGVETRADIDTVMNVLRGESLVGVANPVLEGAHQIPIYMSDALIVAFLPDVSRSAVDSLNAALATEVRAADSRHADRFVVRIRPDLGLSTLDVADLYYRSGLCRYAEPNFISRMIYHGWQEADSMPSGEDAWLKQWHWNNEEQSGGVYDADIDADLAWLITTGTDSVCIAVFDVGFDLYHEDWDTLTRWTGQDLASGPYCYEDTCLEIEGTYAYQVYPNCWAGPQPEEGHGTAVFGVLAAAIGNGKGLRGLAPACELFAVKATNECGYGTPAMFAHAFGWTSEHADIISCSIDPPYYSSEVETTLIDIRAAGVFVAYAAGNDGTVEFPADLPAVTAVGATDDRDLVWSWSARGSSLDFVAPSGNKGLASSSRGFIWTMDMMDADGYVPNQVPAWQCEGSDDYLCKMGGTSASAPQVAGIAGLLLSRRMDFKNSADPAGIIRYVLEGSSEDKGDPGYDTLYGHGRVNAYRALLSVIHGDVTNDGTIDASDLGLLIDILFGGQHAVLDDRTANCNCDDWVDVMDLFLMIDYLYSGGDAPPICFQYYY
jgi:subtilisin family serine protease